MSFYAGSAGSVVVPAAGSAYGMPMQQQVAYAPAPMTAMPAQPYYQPQVQMAMPAVQYATAPPMMYRPPTYAYPAAPAYAPPPMAYYGRPTVIVSSPSRRRSHRRGGFLGYL